MTRTVVYLSIAAFSFGIGIWGRRNIDILVPQTLSREGRARKARQMRRGTTWLIVFAVIVVFLAVAHLFTWGNVLPYL
jgi:hypothetical protein